MTRTIAITGATSGIGYFAALAFARQGANVAISGRRAERGAEATDAINKLGGTGWFQETDVQDPEQVQTFLDGTAEKFGPIDAVISNAGIEPPHFAKLADVTLEDIDAVLNTNLRGTIYTIKYAIPHVRRPGGSIITVSSLWGRQGGEMATVYTSTKGGVESLTRAVAIELGGEGIRVNCVAPGFIKTEMSDRFIGDRDMDNYYDTNIPLKRIGTSDEVADAMVWLASDQSSYVTGQLITVDGGQNIKMSVGGF